MLTHNIHIPSITTRIPLSLLMPFRKIKTDKIAIDVRIIANVFFSTKIVATTSIANEKPITRYTGGNPSLYMGIRKEKYTNASPVSFCKIENAAGVNITAAAISCERGLSKFVSGRDKYFASARAVNILQVSTGCKLKKPNGIHDLEPLISLPTTNVAIIRNIPKT